MNTLTLDKTDPEVAKALEGCEVGKPIKLTVTVTPTQDDDETFVADVDRVSYSQPKPASPKPMMGDDEEAEVPEAIKSVAG